MNHYTLRLVSGRVIDLEAESLYPGIHTSYGEAYRIPFESGYEYVKTSAVESIVEVPIIPPPTPPHVEWDTVDVKYLYDNGLSVRSYNCLKRAGINNIADLLRYIDEHGDLKHIRNLGAHSQREIAKTLFDLYALDIFTGEVKTDGADTR